MDYQLRKGENIMPVEGFHPWVDHLEDYFLERLHIYLFMDSVNVLPRPCVMAPPTLSDLPYYLNKWLLFTTVALFLHSLLLGRETDTLES